MAGHRNAIVFRPTQPTINITRKFAKPKVAQQKPSVFAMPMPIIPPMQLPMLQGIAKLNEQPKPIEVKPEEEIVKPDKKPEVKETPEPKPKTIDLPEYETKEIPGNVTYTVENLDTWYEIIKAKYKLPPNITHKQIVELAHRLSANNFDLEKYPELENMSFEDKVKLSRTKGNMFKVGQEIELPRDLGEINGIKIELREDHEAQEVKDTNYEPENLGYWSQQATYVGDKWGIVDKENQNQFIKGTDGNMYYETEQAALAEIKKLREQDKIAAEQSLSNGNDATDNRQAA